MEWFFTADYIFWTANEDTLEFAVASAAIGNQGDPSATVGQTKVYHTGDKWNSGFKVGLGTVTCHDGWDVDAQYTWYNSKSSKNTGFSSTPGLFDMYWIINGAELGGLGKGLASFNQAKSKWHLKMNVIDLDLGRNFYVSQRLMLRPFCGLKGTWQTQTMDVELINTTVVLDTYNKSRVWGIGARGGLDTSWHFTKCFSILGDLAFSGLFERFKVTRVDTENNTGVFSSKINLVEKLHLMNPVIEWSLGLKWETGISCDQYHFSVSAAWEQQYWFEQNKFLKIIASGGGAGGNLDLAGLTVDFRFDF